MMELWLPFYQHGIAIAEKAIALIYRMLVSTADIFESAKRGHEHHQGRARKMEIGQQPLDYAKPVSRGDKNIGIAMTGSQFTSTVPRRRSLQGAQRRSSDGHHPSACGDCSLYGLHCFLGHVK